MKVCKDCNQTKSYSEFMPKLSNKDGYETRCKPCRNIRYNKSTPYRVFKKIYNSQITHSVARGHTLPSYTLKELLNWVDTQPHKFDLWNAYVNSNYQNSLRPSIDRLDDSKPYSLDNIQLVTWKENRDKGALHKKIGLIQLNHKPVSAFHKSGEFYKSFISINEALREVGGHGWGITTVANKEKVKDGRGYLYTPKTYKGYKWEWT